MAPQFPYIAFHLREARKNVEGKNDEDDKRNQRQQDNPVHPGNTPITWLARRSSTRMRSCQSIVCARTGLRLSIALRSGSRPLVSAEV